MTQSTSKAPKQKIPHLGGLLLHHLVFLSASGQHGQFGSVNATISPELLQQNGVSAGVNANISKLFFLTRDNGSF